MFLTIAIPVSILAIISMFCMDSFYKAFMLVVVLLIAAFLLFLFINYPLPSALAVCSMAGLFRLRFKD